MVDSTATFDWNSQPVAPPVAQPPTDTKTTGVFDWGAQPLADSEPKPKDTGAFDWASQPLAQPSQPTPHTFIPGRGAGPIPQTQPPQPSVWQRISSWMDRPAGLQAGEAMISGELAPLLPLEQKAKSYFQSRGDTTAAKLASGYIGAQQGGVDVASSMATPKTLGLMAATFGLGTGESVAAQTLSRLASAGFSIQSLKSAYDNFPQLKAAITSGDTQTAMRLLTSTGANVAMGAAGAIHAVTGASATPRPTETAPATPADAIRQAGYKYLGELTPGSDVHQFEDVNAPGKTVAMRGKDITSPDAVRAKMAAKLNEFQSAPIAPDSPLARLLNGQRPPQVRVTDTHAQADALEPGQPQPGFAKVVPDDHLPSVSQNEILAQAVQRMASNSDELQNAGIDPSSIASPEDVSRQLESASAVLKNNLDPRVNNVLTFEMQRQLAADLGMTVEDLLSRKSGAPFNAEEVTAARSLLKASQDRVLDFAKQAASGNPDDLKSFTDALAQHKEIGDVVRGQVAKEAGRALGAFRIDAADLPKARVADLLSTLSPDAQARAAELLSRIDPNNSAAVNKIVQELTPTTTADKVFEIFQNALLSSPRTAVIKGASDASMLVLDALSKSVAGAIEQGKSAFTGDTPQRYALDGWSFAKGAARALGRAGDVMLGHDELPGFESHGTPANKGLFGQIVRTPMLVLSRITDAAHTLNYSGQLETLAYRQAMSEGLTGDALRARQAALVNDPSPTMRQAAFDFARKQTFQAPLGEAGRSLQKTIRTVPGLRYITPFFKTPANILKTAGEFSPYGLAKGTALSNVDLAARGLVGSAIASAVAYHSLQGNITGGGPIETAKKSTLEATGWQPYSIKVGNRYYSYNRLEPLGTVLSLTADLAHAINGGIDPESAEATSRADHIKQIVEKNLDLPFVYSLSNLMASLEPGNRKGASEFIDRQLADLVPAGVAATAQTMDPTLRRPENLAQHFEARIPGLTQNVPAITDIAGQPVQRPTNELGGMNPFPVSTQRNDPAIAELSRLGEVSEELPTTATQPRKGLGLKIGQRAPRLALTPDEGRAIQNQDERMLHAWLTAMVATSDWRAMSDDERRSAVKRARSEITQTRYERVTRMRNQNSLAATP